MAPTAYETAARTPRVRAAVASCLEVAGWIVTLLVVGFVVASFIMMSRGYRMVAVTSGSMRPTYEVGDGVLVKPRGDHEIQVGDVVIFSAGDHTPAIHRVVGYVDVYGQQRHYRTKGDANAEPDEQLVPGDAIEAIGYRALPQAGRIFYALSTNTGRAVLIGLLLLAAGREVVVIVQVRRRMKARAAAGRAVGAATLADLGEGPDVPTQEKRSVERKTRSGA